MPTVFSGFTLLSRALTFKGKNWWADGCLEVQLKFLRGTLGPHLCSRYTWGRWCFYAGSRILNTDAGLAGCECSVAVRACVKPGRERMDQLTCLEQATPGG